MAILNAKEFSEMCGIPRTSLPVYEKRGQVVFTGTGIKKRYDTDEDKNKLFYQQMNAKKGNNVESASKRSKFSNVVTEESVSEDDYNDEVEKGNIPALHISERKLKFLDTQKREREIELQNLKIQKQKGEVVPTELIAPIFLQQNQNMMVELKNGMDEVIRRIAKKYDLKSEDIADFRRMVTHSINGSAKSAIENSKKHLEIIINEYAEKRGVGERG